MKLVLEKARDFQKSVNAIAVLIDEAEFVIDAEKLALKATDPSQISMVDFELEKKAFKEFQVKETVTLGLDLDYLAQVMGRAKPDDELTLEINEGKTTLKVGFKGASSRHFVIPLIDVSKGSIPQPKIEFQAVLLLQASLLQDALKDAELISNHVTLGVSNESFYVRANSSKGKLDSETGRKEKPIKEFKIGQECQSMFPLDYLKDMLKTADSKDEIELKLRADAPVQVGYKIGKARITYFLAPRIESD